MKTIKMAFDVIRFLKVTSVWRYQKMDHGNRNNSFDLKASNSNGDTIKVVLPPRKQKPVLKVLQGGKDVEPKRHKGYCPICGEPIYNPDKHGENICWWQRDLKAIFDKVNGKQF